MARGNLSFMKCCPVTSSAILVLLWDYLLYFHNLFIRHFMTLNISSGHSFHIGWYIIDLLQCLALLSFPLFGLLADVCIGRYRAVLIGIVLCFLSWISAGVGYLIESYYHYKVILYTAYGIAYLLGAAGYLSFKANIVQYNLDQLVGASADQLNTIIYWHATAIPIANFLYRIQQCLVEGVYLSIMTFIVPGVAVSLVLVTHSFFKYKLENISLINNPLKLIARVLHYARKHKYRENRSALTYWEEEAPSRLDLGKEKYGGPFTEEEVEDVKTFFRMLPLFIAVIGFACTDDYSWTVPGNLSLISRMISIGIAYYTCSIVLLLVYLLLIRVCFYKYIPSMLTRMSIGLICSLTVVISKFIIFKFFPVPDSPYSNKLLFLPQLLQGVSFVLLFPASMEFTIAQTPMHMRGVMVGIWIASIGVGYFINMIVAVPFGCRVELICTSPYYYLTKSGIVLLILIVFVILAKRYKYRVRENEVNIHQIVDDHYQRYIEQEEEYNKEIDMPY